jgi:hypothetical protein
MKAIIFDSSTIISFTMNGLLSEFEKLKGIFKGKFLITEEVKREIIDKPMTIKRFSLEAMKVKRLIEIGVIETAESIGINNKEIAQGTAEFMEKANKTLKGRGKDIELISDGEASCLALSKILTEKKIENVIAIDERTTRVLCEKPESLKKIMEKKLHIHLESNNSNYKFFSGFKFIRSAELIYVAYKKKITVYKNGDVLDALLYAMRYKGCFISDAEITEMKKIGQ